MPGIPTCYCLCSFYRILFIRRWDVFRPVWWLWPSLIMASATASRDPGLSGTIFVKLSYKCFLQLCPGQYCADIALFTISHAQRPVQTKPTCWSNIIQHCWMQHVGLVWTLCWMMLNNVGRCWLEFKLAKNFRQLIVRHLSSYSRRNYSRFATNKIKLFKIKLSFFFNSSIFFGIIKHLYTLRSGNSAKSYPQ
jgi:hypothetical protein